MGGREGAWEGLGDGLTISVVHARMTLRRGRVERMGKSEAACENGARKHAWVCNMTRDNADSDMTGQLRGDSAKCKLISCSLALHGSI